MAIISIPSSIGGVSIPGNLLKGPLAKLFGGGSNIETYSYPRDLGSATRGHWIQFVINEIEPTQYDTGKISNLFNNGVSAAQNDVAGAPATTAQNPLAGIKTTTAAVKNVVSGAVDAGKEAYAQATEKTNLSLKPKKTRLAATIGLYMPDGMSFTNNASYGNVSLLDAAQSALQGVQSLFGGNSSKRGIISGIASAIDGGINAATSNAGKLLLSTQGLAINPGQQLLFDGIDFRTYSLSFTFTPYSKEEADTVKSIIKLFKTHAAPRISQSGMFFIPPSTFNLGFYKDGGINSNIAAVGESVIESIEVNYAPNGWSAHTDGAPVQTTLTLNFKEIELVDRAKIEFAGY
jgi:hypothetical protein